MKILKLHKALSFVLAFAMLVTTLHLDAFHLFAAEKANLALNKPVTASYAYPGDKFKASNAVDGNLDTRWATESAPNGGGVNQWLMIDLGEAKSFNQFLVASEVHDGSNLGKFRIEGSNDTGETKQYTSIFESSDKATTGGFPFQQTLDLPEVVSYRFVRITVEKLITGAYPSISLTEFQIFNVDVNEQDPDVNVALNQTAKSSGNEDVTFGPEKVLDGDTTSKESRWASAQNAKPSWISVNLGKESEVRTIKLFWERRNATDYEIQTANTENEPSEVDWKTVKSFKKIPAYKNQKIVLDETVKANFIRVKVNDYNKVEEGSTISWGTVSLYEIEVYGGVITSDINDVVEKLTIASPSASDTKLNLGNALENEDYDITYNGTDYEQVIGSDLTIYKPIVDTNVKVSFKITNPKTKEYKFKEVAVVVPGQYTKAETDNALPKVLPELREWKGGEGNFSITESSKIVIASADLKETADVFAADYKDMTGKTLAVQVGGTASAGDFYFALTTDTSKGLQEEGYLLNIEDKISVESVTTTASYWATRSILQILKQNNNTTIPRGITRDYPLYKVRGFILDVARKPFTLEWLKELTTQMSWYKMNDFQVHLNDNLISLGWYTDQGLDAMQAYSGFRLESDVKKGGNGGLNQADLTSTDEFYTKDEFRNYIKESRVRGMSIVPEIDTPAHSLALTKVRPDLRIGTSGIQNDHLNLTTKYDESVGFVKSIFSEYMFGEDPVFDEQTKVHVGADEYHASSEAYRKFSNDMLNFVKASGRKPRIWGSLTNASVGEPVPGEGVEINLWNFGYANMDKMYEEGFDLINCNDGHYYIVPNAGYYYDYLNQSGMYNWDINTIGGVTIPAGDKQMIGGSFAVWNDMTDYRSNGVTEYDVYDRIQNALPFYAAKVWGRGNASYNEAITTEKSIGEAPNTNLRYKVESKDDNIAQYNLDDLTDSSANANDLAAGKNSAIKNVDYKKALKLNGSESYVTTPVENAGLGNDLRVKVKKTSNSKDEQILFESSYGSIKAVQVDTGKVGFSREGYNYSFNYELPVNVWVELEFKNVLNRTQLYVNGTLVDTLGDDETAAGRPFIATLILPFEYIGSKTKSFNGYVKDVRLSKNAVYASTSELDLAVLNAREFMNAGNDHALLKSLCDQAVVLSTSYNPGQAAIDLLCQSIKNEMAKLDYERANYANIDVTLTTIPSDLSLFTAASVSNVLLVKNAIRRELHKGIQATVDGYAAALQDAINSLELKPLIDLYIVDSSTLKATADSSQGGGESPASAIDKNPSTMWHTAYNNTTMPHSLVLELQENTMISGYSYLPRENGGNGNITKYEIWVSESGSAAGDYKKVTEGNWERNTSLKKVEFAPINAKFVKLVAVEAVGNFASAAEVTLFRANVTPDIAGLKAIIKEASEVVNVNFTKESWDALQSAIADAQLVADQSDADANVVAAKKNAVLKAKVSLKLVGEAEIEDTTLAKSILKSAIDKATAAEASEEFKTLAPSVQALIISMRNAAQIVYANAAATNSQCIDAWINLANALHFLEFQANKEDLKNLIKACNAINTNEYTGGVEEFKAALVNAQSVYDNQNALQASIDKAYDRLDEARMNLVKNVVNKGILESMISSIEKQIGDGSKYKQDENWNVFVKALADAKVVLDSEVATQADVNAATSALSEAYMTIRLLPSEEQLAELNGFLAAVKGINRRNFTSAQLTIIDGTVEKVKAMINDFDEKQFASTQTAMAKSLGIINEVTAKNPSISGVPGNVDGVKPNTGDNTNMAVILLALLISGCGVVFMLRRRNKKAL